jgi:hypothetical protein
MRSELGWAAAHLPVWLNYRLTSFINGCF